VNVQEDCAWTCYNIESCLRDMEQSATKGVRYNRTQIMLYNYYRGFHKEKVTSDNQSMNQDLNIANGQKPCLSPVEKQGTVIISL
jgi:hypothetical protein